jgi:hypothetical protein
MFGSFRYFVSSKQLSRVKPKTWLAVGQRFSPGTPVSSISKIDHHDIAEILLKVALNTKNIIIIHLCDETSSIHRNAKLKNGLMKVIMNVPDGGYHERAWWRLLWAYLMKIIMNVPDGGYHERTWWRLLWAYLMKIIMSVCLKIKYTYDFSCKTYHLMNIFWRSFSFKWPIAHINGWWWYFWCLTPLSAIFQLYHGDPHIISVITSFFNIQFASLCHRIHFAWKSNTHMIFLVKRII